MAEKYDINYDDERFTQVETDKTTALNEVDKAYGEMISQSDKFYQQQIDASKGWADKQSQLQQEQTDFAIEQIQQQKDQAQKDYIKEQSGAYADWKKQSNEYGVSAEEMASAGLAKTGFSESSQVSMYNTYQNRVAAARESFNRAILNYDNAMAEARLQGNAALAEIAYNALQQQLELALQGFQYKNQLILDQTSKKLELDQMYYGRWQDVLNQINTENAMAEEIRQFNESLAEEKRQYNESLALEQEQWDWKKAQEALKQTASGGGGGGVYEVPKDDGGEEPVNNPVSGNPAPVPKQSTGKFNEVAFSNGDVITQKDYVTQQYNLYKSSGASTALTDELLKAAVAEGIMSQREATNLRNGR